ncbi:MAG: hypothetical protein PHE58_05235 [Candidatus Omnitrophica bacterium]|nr:hypothetical protein [Candidatus Omnitrophota bacterium]
MRKLFLIGGIIAAGLVLGLQVIVLAQVTDANSTTQTSDQATSTTQTQTGQQGIQDTVQDYMAKQKELHTKFSTELQTLLSDFKTKTQSLRDEFNTSISGLSAGDSGYQEAVKTFSEGIKSLAKDFRESMQTLFKSFREESKTLRTEFMDKIKESLPTTGEDHTSLGSILGNGNNKDASSLKSLGKELRNEFKEAMKELKELRKEALAAVRDDTQSTGTQKLGSSALEGVRQMTHGIGAALGTQSNQDAAVAK